MWQQFWSIKKPCAKQKKLNFKTKEKQISKGDVESDHHFLLSKISIFVIIWIVFTRNIGLLRRFWKVEWIASRKKVLCTFTSSYQRFILYYTVCSKKIFMNALRSFFSILVWIATYIMNNTHTNNILICCKDIAVGINHVIPIIFNKLKLLPVSEPKYWKRFNKAENSMRPIKTSLIKTL